MNKFRRFTALLLCVALLLSGSTFASAAVKTTTVYKTEKIYTAKETYTLPMWHYSGNYWKIGSGSAAQKVNDQVIDRYGNLTDYLDANYSSITYRVSLPDTVKKAREDGNEIRVTYESRGNASMNSIFRKDTIHVITDVCDGKDYFEFSVTPIYNLVKKYDFTTFVSGLGKSIPLINYRYGQNVYSIFGNGANAVQANGFFNEACLSDVSVPYMHPSFILDKSGKLDSGNIISLGGKTVSTRGYTVGQGTFSNAGACGINFVFPINVIFSKVTATQVTVETPDENQQPQTGNSDGGNTPVTPAEPTLPPEPEHEPDPDVTDIHPVLSLPDEAYEGQTVTANDNSTFDFNGSYYSASSAYSKGIASGSFHYPGAQYKSRTKTSVDIAYPEAGIYCVTLDISAKSGEEGSDAKAIKILPCPAVHAAIGGKQLQNRKQSLSVTVQQNPKYPITELKIKISEPVSGESILISRNFGGPQAPPANSAHIKYRSLWDTGSDENAIASQVDFLSKFSENKTFTYEVTATDSRGRSDRAEGKFLVEKDTPPVAKIGIADCYYRQQNSDTAVIQLSDESLGSGNFQRTWTFDGSNFKDLSFGTKKNVSFERQGVGKFTVGLKIKDLWTDETLEEYVTDADYLCSETSASSVVDNIAPVVSLEMRSAAAEEILLLASDKDTRTNLEAALPSLKAELAGRGINADIHVEQSLSGGVQKTGALRLVRQVSTPTLAMPKNSTIYYAHMESEFWSRGHVTADTSAIYSMDSTNFVKAVKKGSYFKRDYPFYIKAFDSRTGNEKWTFSITEGTMHSADNFENAFLGHDEQGKYLYLISDGGTLLIDKAGGGFVRMVDAEMGSFNFIQNGCIFSFKTDGIYRLDAAGFSKIYSGSIFTGQNMLRTLGGKVRFAELKNGAISLSTFDPAWASVSSVKLEGTDAASQCMSIDTRGNVLVRLNAYTFNIYSVSGKKNGSTSLNNSVDASVPAYDGSGRVHYVAGSYRERTGRSDSRKYYNYMVTGGLYSSFHGSNYIMKRDDYRSFTDVVSAVECNDGVVAATLPALVIVGDDYPLYSMTEYNFSTTGGGDNCSILCSTGMPPTDYIGWFEGGTSISIYNSVYNCVAMAVNISESEKDETERLKAKWLSSPDGICIRVSGNVSADTIMNAIGGKEENVQPPSRIYRRNEAIDYNIYYSDYEGDPSAASYWLYTHEPGSDGLWENSGKILSAPVNSFAKEGRYTLVHWQKDDAGRGLTSEFDKESNRCTMVFYITGGDPAPSEENAPPQITNITVDPQNVPIGEDCDVHISVNDPDGDSLHVDVEIYRSGSDDPVRTWHGDVSPSGGTYPEITVRDVPVNEPGVYEIIVRASDGKASDVESASFTPTVASGLNAAVEHTESWESNRQNFNEKNFGDPGAGLISDFSTYAASDSPRKRGRNVFWPGEKLVLNADLTGEAISVTAQIQGCGFSTVLLDAGNGRFTGSMYDSSMKTVFDTGSPLQVTVHFTATYKNSAPLSFDIPIIFDQDTGYWALHRTR